MIFIIFLKTTKVKQKRLHPIKQRLSSINTLPENHSDIIDKLPIFYDSTQLNTCDTTKQSFTHDITTQSSISCMTKLRLL